MACLLPYCESAAQVDHSPCCVVAIGCLLYHTELTMQLSRKIWQLVERVVIVSISGPLMGGLPTIPAVPCTFFRGGSDLLPLQLPLIQTSLKFRLSRVIADQITSITPSKNTNFVVLVSEPTCINIIQPLRPE